MEESYDLVVVGAGPAGLTSALYGSRALLKTVVLERGVPGGELLNTQYIENFISYPKILGSELAERFATHAREAGAEIKEFINVTSVRKRLDGLFETRCDDGAVYLSPAVIVTAGGTPVKLEIPGEGTYSGRGVSYCAICDASFFKGHHIVVAGGGDAAVEEGSYLAGYGSRITVIHRRDKFRASKLLQERLFDNPKVDVRWNTVAEEVLGDDRGSMSSLQVRDVVTGEQSVIDATGLFVFIGFRPNTGVIADPCDHDDMGYVVTDEAMMSSVPGLFVAGDMRAQLTRQVTTAVGDGTTAAVAAEKYIKTFRETQTEGKTPELAESLAASVSHVQAGGYT